MMTAYRLTKNKYGNRKTQYDGRKFDSVKEKNRYRILVDLQTAGEISDLRAQVKFVLIPTQRDPKTGKVLERECSYIADFVYVDNKTGTTVIEDVKGFRTADYIIKRKLMLEKYGIRIQEI